MRLMAIGAELGDPLCLQRQAHKLRVAPLLGAEYLDLTDVSKLPKVEQKTIYSWGLWKSLPQLKTDSRLLLQGAEVDEVLQY